MVTYKNMQIPFMPQSFFDETKVTVKKKLYLYSNDGTIFKETVPRNRI